MPIMPAAYALKSQDFVGPLQADHFELAQFGTVEDSLGVCLARPGAQKPRWPRCPLYFLGLNSNICVYE